MAEIKPSTTVGNDKYQLITWANVTQADTFGAALVGRMRDVTMQVLGTFGGATVVLQGSMDGTNFAGLTDDGTAPISVTTAAVAKAFERTKFMRPSHSGGAGESITVILGGSLVY